MEPAVREASHPVEDPVRGAAHPDRDAARRSRFDARERDGVEAALEVHDGLLEEPPEQLDLLGDAAASGVEVLPERLVLHLVPADADAEAEPDRKRTRLNSSH